VAATASGASQEIVVEMRQISIEAETFARLALAARMSAKSVAEIVRELVEDAARTDDDDAESVERPSSSKPEVAEVSAGRPIFVVYKKQRVEAEFDVATAAIRIKTGDLAGQEFESPSAAAIGVVSAINPSRQRPETNGWRFWRDPRTGRTLEAAYRRPRRNNGVA
jgi:hypothetical protein